VEAACLEAQEIAEYLRQNPFGDNYDFRAFRSIDVVVCLPYTMFLPIGVATTLLQNRLLAAVTLGELVRFLNVA
jgi:hypothetical protein